MKAKPILFIIVLLSIQNLGVAQIQISVNSMVDKRKEISPYIYGLNPYHYDPNLTGMQLHDAGINVTSLRIGGDAISSYNWEINRSTHNNDCGDGNGYFNNYNGTFAPYVSGQPNGDYNIPGGAKLKLVQDANQLDAYPLIQVSALPKVSSENMGCLVGMEENDRFKDIALEKPGNLSLNPDINDGFVYADEEINYLLNEAGNSNSENGIKGFCLENEPGLWKYTHPYAHPTSPTLGEILETNIGLAERIKDLDPNSETFGLGAYGFMEFWHGVQDAPAVDYNTYMTNIPGYDDVEYKYMRWLAAYLYQMNIASNNYGSRILDALDIHFYNNGNNLLQDSRSFWDPSYTENSWITNDVIGGPYDAANTFHKLIDDYYPGTKLSVSEWGHFSPTIQSSIYVADMLGAFGTKDVYLATYFGRLNGYLAGSFKIYTNYDGANNRFGAIGVEAISSDNHLVSAYSSIDSDSEEIMHIVLINRSPESQNTQINVSTASTVYSVSEVYAMTNGNNGLITQLENISITDNSVSVKLSGYSVYHLVLKESLSTSEIESKTFAYPNPTTGKVYFSSDIKETEIYTLNGYKMNVLSSAKSVDLSDLPSGTYILKGTDLQGNHIQQKIIKK